VRVIRPLPVLALVALSFPLPGSAVAQTPIRFGQVVTGRLTPMDPRFADSSHYKTYEFEGKRGETITLDLASDDFDANVLLADGSGNTLARNDDGGVNCNARLTHVLRENAKYRIYANSSAGLELGEYRLTLWRGKRPAPADTVCHSSFGRVTGIIRVGQALAGKLDREDATLSSDSTYYERWILPVAANESLTVDLESNDFDAFVMLARGRGDKLVDNDDGAGGCNARVVYATRDDHPLRILVNTASKNQAGRYTLRVSRGFAPTEAKGNCRFTPRREAGGGATGAHAMTVGQAQQGALTSDDAVSRDSTYAQAWTLQARAGQTVTIDLESDEFDAYVLLRGPGITGGRAYEDDDSGGNCNARLTVTFPQSGEYEIVVNTTGTKYATGGFTLSVTSGSKPKSLARCSRSQ
jgi:hypothetical protein